MSWAVLSTLFVGFNICIRLLQRTWGSRTGLGKSGDQEGGSPSAVPPGIKKINDSVYSLNEPEGSTEIEIVFVHGRQLSNHKDDYRKTFTSGEKDKDGTEICWPEAWLSLGKELPGARTLSFSYDSFASLTSAAESLLQEMVDFTPSHRRESCPIVFVCHSLGGLVVKQVVRSAHAKSGHDPKYAAFLKNIRGFSFYGTPREGSRLADLASHLPNVGKALLKRTKIGRLNADFEQIARDYICRDDWKFFAVGETINTTLYGFKDIVLSKASTRHGYEFMVVRDNDNFGVYKPKGKESISYLELVNFIAVAMGKRSMTWSNYNIEMLIKFEVLISKVSNSINNEVKGAKMNVYQCRRLANRINGFVEQWKFPKDILRDDGYCEVLESLSILLKKALSLVIECGGSKWVTTTLVRGNNEEAYIQVHNDLSNLLNRASDFASNDEDNNNFKNAISAPSIYDMCEDALHDFKYLLKMRRNFQGCIETFSRVYRNPPRFLTKGLTRLRLKLRLKLGPRFDSNLQLFATKHDFKKIIKVVSEKNRDQASNHVLSEQGSSASYLQIQESDIVIKRFLGIGSYGDVHEVEWLGCRMCLKDFPWPGGYNKQWLKHAMPILKLRHPNILQLVGISTSMVNTRPPKMLTETMEGDIRSLIDKTMAEQSGEGTPFTWWMTLYIMIQVIRGLAFMHQNGFMHGDRVLTTNIIIKVCGDFVDARIGDFGVPADISMEFMHVYEPRKVVQWQILETARWMAPEVCAGGAPFSVNSDIYGFGVFCYELLTGKIPFDQYTDDVRLKIRDGELKLELPSDVDKRVAEIIKKCLHVDPSLRPEASVVVKTLESIWLNREDM
ncbi:hypothetical protein M758_10G175600 [Ceratodon purpureus]|nr:hypothetical protein M758_10G175600 [Ceratodon purpureus]